MPIQCFPLGPLETNCYLVHEQSDALVIDPGGAVDELTAFIAEKGLNLKAVIITHMHFDHIYGVAQLVQESAAKGLTVPVFAPAGDTYLTDNPAGKGGMWGFPEVPPFDWVDLAPGEHSFLSAALPFTVLHTPGHTRGSLSLYFPLEKAVVTGDLIFYRSVGRTDFEGGNSEDLLQSIRDKIFTLPPDTVIYPGHGPATSVSDEYNNNPYCGAFKR